MGRPRRLSILIAGVATAVLATGFLIGSPMWASERPDNWISVSVPAPSTVFHRACIDDIRAASERYMRPFVAGPVGDNRHGVLGLAVLASPQYLWGQALQRRAVELWTCRDAEDRWRDVLKVMWEPSLHILLHLSSVDPQAVLFEPVGTLRTAWLETSAGKWLEADVDKRLYVPAISHDGHSVTYWLSFDRSQALPPGAKWLRLHVDTGRSTLTLEWSFVSL